jgi:hypothetical protein
MTAPPLISPDLLDKLGGDALKAPQYLRSELAALAESDHAGGLLKGAHDALRESFAAIDAACRSADPSMTPQAHFLDVKGRADAALDRIAKNLTDARNAAERQIEAIENDIQAAMRVSESSRANEIRSYLRGLKPKDRSAFVLASIDAGDTETLGAIFSGPAYLSGFDMGEAGEKQRSVYVGRYREKVAPEMIAKQDVLRSAIEINSTALNQFLDAHSKIFPVNKVEEIASRVNAAKARKAAI